MLEAHNYLPQEILDRFAEIGNQSETPIEDVIIVAKYFTPDAGWTWYATEYDPEYKVFYGFVQWLFDEWGSFALEDLQKIRGQLRLPVERDLFFDECRFWDLFKDY